MSKLYIISVISGSLILLSSLGCSSNDENTVEVISKKPINEINIAIKTEPIIDERKVLENSFFGNFTKRKTHKIKGHTTLEIWMPYYEHIESGFPGLLFSENGNQLPLKLDVEYDEIWITEHDEGLSKKEIFEAKGTLNIVKLYWKDGKVQATSVDVLYVANPRTGAALLKPTYKTTFIRDRSYILRHAYD